jgi:hypothetical protein
MGFREKANAHLFINKFDILIFQYGSRDEDLHLVEAVALSMFYVAGGKARTP